MLTAGTLDRDVLSELLEEAPGPGVYEDVPFAEYVDWPYINNSGLSHILERSPLHYLASLKEPYEPSRSQILGDRIHKAVLEPALFDDRFDMAGQCEAITGSGSRCSSGGKVRVDGKWFCHRSSHQPDGAEPDDIETIKPGDYETCMRVREAVLSHPMAGPIIETANGLELSYVWEESTTDLLCKGRLDVDNAEISTIADLKTTKDASEGAFERAVANYGYHRAACFYKNGAAALDRHRDEFNIIAAEKTRPYAVAVYRINRRALDRGAEKVAEALFQYKYCLESGQWPGYGDEIIDLDLPGWAYRN